MAEQSEIKQSRREEKFTLSPIAYLRDIGNAHNTEANAFEAGKRAQLEHNRSQISQLFPQPLDKELREKMVNTLFALCTEPKFVYAAWRCSKSESPDIVGLIDMPQFQMAVNKALALLPDIEEARKQERDRILKLFDDMMERKAFVDLHIVIDHFRQALKGSK